MTGGIKFDADHTRRNKLANSNSYSAFILVLKARIVLGTFNYFPWQMVVSWLIFSALIALFYDCWFETPWYFAFAIFVVNTGLFFLYRFLYQHSSEHRQQQMFAVLRQQEDQLTVLKNALIGLNLEKAATQIENLNDKVSDLKQVANLRFSEGELAMERYIGAATQVSQLVVYNLSEIRIAKTSIQSINPEDILSKIEQAHGDEKDQLKARLTLLEEQNSKIKGLVEDNTRAITSLAKTATALADIKQVSDFEQHAVMEELQQLAKRAALFNK